MKKLIACLLILCFAAVQLASCTAIAAQDLMIGVKSQKNAPEITVGEKQNDAYADFALKLFSAGADEDKNLLLSPISVYCALAMTANGAKGETLEQFENVLGMPADELNDYSYTFFESKKGDQALKIADSIWFRDSGFEADRGFLQINADNYGAAAYKARFDDSTVKDINQWVKDATGGEIEKMIDMIPDEAYIYLINAICFQSAWNDVYEKHDVYEGVFRSSDGSEQKAEYMVSCENRYISGDNCTGFIKQYSGGKYAFAALLPNEGVSASEVAASLSGAELRGMLSGAENAQVKAEMPKFGFSYDCELSNELIDMGLVNAFGDDSDLSGLGKFESGKAVISRVIHKTFISVDENGTKAAAATAVELKNGGTAPLESVKRVKLDRPFVFVIFDNASLVPLFIGITANLNG